jgi:hypothetical protein
MEADVVNRNEFIAAKTKCGTRMFPIVTSP